MIKLDSTKNLYDLAIAYFQEIQQVSFPKNTIVVHQGELMHQLYYIKKGIVRGYYLDECGKEVTKCFSSEEEIFGVEGFLHHREASYSIDCLEDVICYKLTYDEVRIWMSQEPSHVTIVNEMVIDALRLMEERAKSLLLSDAKQRYERFFVDYGNIANRMSQKCIATYLGINEATLCRLKKKLT